MAETAQGKQELPLIDPEVMAALHDTYAADPNEFIRSVAEHARSDPKFTFQIFQEGRTRAQGDVRIEEAFAEGALFAATAIERTLLILNTDQLDARKESTK